MEDEFVSLHTHSEFSLLDGLAKTNEIAKRASSLGQKAVALTDHGECGGHLQFQRSCDEQNLKSILGMEGYQVDSVTRVKEEKDKSRGHIILLAENNEGLKNLWTISSLAYIEGKYYKPLTDWALLKKYSRGIIATDSCLYGMMAKNIVKDDYNACVELLGQYIDTFGENNFYMELHTWQFKNPETEEQKKLNNEMTLVNKAKVELARRFNVPFVVVNDCHYACEDQWENHGLVWAMSTNQDAIGHGEAAAHLMSSEEVYYWMSKHGIPREVTEEAIHNTALIGERCTARIKTIDAEKEEERCAIHLPTVTASLETDKELFLRLVEKGWKEKVEDNPERDSEKYLERLKYEVKLIIDKGYAAYFTMVADTIKYARDKGWLVGPGRGSAGGSLVSYLLEIIELDPIKYGLLFERFLNPDRKDFPDIDMDFPQSKRQEIKKYLEDKYGKDKICTIGTFSRFHPRGLVRDLGRAMKIPYNVTDAISKILDTVKDVNVVRIDVTLEDMLRDKGPELEPYMKQYPKLFQKMDEMMGLIRQSSVHASGVIVSDETLLGILPMRTRSVGEDNEEIQLVSQFEAPDVEALGFIKFDVLGLRHLDTKMQVAEMVGKDPLWYYTFGEKEYTDKEVLGAIINGKTVGVTTLETPAMTAVCKSLKPKNEADVATLVAINRPGVVRVGGLAKYLARRNGTSRVSYRHALLEDRLGDTYGIIVYQEQVMQVVREIGGYTPGETAHIRKLMGKMMRNEMKSQREKFVSGCLNNKEFIRLAHKNPEEIANEIFSDFEATGVYTFNKCITGNTVITRDNGGRYGSREITVEELYRRWWANKFPENYYPHVTAYKYQRRGLYILAHKDGRIKPDKVTSIQQNGVKEVWRVVLANGKEITATSNHRHLTTEGWRQVSELVVGDMLVTKGSYATGSRKRKYSKGYTTVPIPIVAIEYAGHQMTYDLTMEGEDHSFVGNGIVTHNSHSVGLGLVAYWDAYIKYYYPAEFMTALMRTDPKSVPRYIREARREHIKILPPDINVSGWGFVLDKNKENQGIRFGLSSVAHVGPAALREIIEHRPFRSLQDLLERTSKRAVKKKVVENLISVGALDSFYDNDLSQRGQALSEYYNFRGEGKDYISPDFTNDAVLQETEMRLLGTFVTKDPMSKYIEYIDGNCISNPDEIEELEVGQTCRVGGQIARVKLHEARNGRMAFMTVRWNELDFSVTVFADKYEAYSQLLHTKAPIVCRVQRLEKGCCLRELTRLDYTQG